MSSARGRTQLSAALLVMMIGGCANADQASRSSDMKRLADGHTVVVVVAVSGHTIGWLPE